MSVLPAQTNPQALLMINALVNKLANCAKEHMRKRADVRYPCDQAATLGSRPNGGSFKPLGEIWLLDLCYQGVGWLVEQPLLVGRRYYILLLTPLGECVVPVDIVYCRRLAGSIYRIGATFQFETP